MAGYLLFLPLLLLPLSTGDELTSVRCQSKCIHNLEIKNQHNSDVRKAMRHHVVSVCAADRNCSSCTLPCSESFDNTRSCTDKFCSKLESDARLACEESCSFLEKIYSEKPGTCPSKDKIDTVYECAAACHLDGDCRETEKCCVMGCSRKCIAPEKADASLPPLPHGITVTERKRKRSAILRWSMRKGKKKNTDHSDLSSLFVIQWRWGLHESTMGGWQTILVKNKPYAILKHILSPGRLYEFRIAAVSIHGSRGFSAPSAPFKLSKEARAPNAPTVTLGASRISPSGLWTQTVQWTVPPSDLPIKNYEVSWEESTQSEANSFEGRTSAALTRHLDDEEDDSVDAFSLGGFEGRKERKTTIVPAHHTSLFVEGLRAEAVYLVEVHAIVDSSDGELHGEKGLVFITTSSLTLAESEETSQATPTRESGVPLSIQEPRVEKGKLVTGVSWIDTGICTRRGSYRLRLRSISCSGQSTESDWEERILSSCSTMLDSLEFDCRYEVRVNAHDNEEETLSSFFSTLPCPSTLSPSSPLCLPSSPLTCSLQSFVVLCHWPHDHNSKESTIGYRVSLTSLDAKTSEISILPPQNPETTFQNLRSGVEYSVEVQSITTKGLGSSMTTRFVSPTKEEEIKDQSIIDHHLQDGEIIELPLGSSTYHLLIYLPILTILLRIVL